MEKSNERLEHEKYIRDHLVEWAERIDALVGRVNAGFTIIDAARPARRQYGDDHIAYALAHDARRRKYVTWLYNADSNGFAQGHYFEDRDGSKSNDELLHAAGNDLRERAGIL